MITSGMSDTNDISVKMYMRLISDLNTYKEDLKYFNETSNTFENRNVIRYSLRILTRIIST